MKKNLSLKVQVTILLFAFVTIMLGLIYLFQTAFLDDFYYKQKISTLKNISANITSTLETTGRSDGFSEYGMSNEVCIRTVSNVERYNNNCGCSLKDMSVDTINQVARITIDNGGDYLFDDFKYVSKKEHRRDNLYLYARYLEINGDAVMVMVSSIVTPLDVTVKTLKSQYLVIALIVITMTAILSLLISAIVIRPLKRINAESRKLAQGEYEASNINPGSKEFGELNNTLEKANTDIISADTARKELIGNVSHDLRTPLTMIVGYGEMMKDIPEEMNEENVDIIINEAKRLSSLVDDMLMLSKLDAGQIDLNLKALSAGELLKEVYGQYEKYCESIGAEISLEINEEFEFIADKNRMEQVLYNFVNNALNYNSKDEQKIVLGTRKQDDETYRIYVHDNGDGINENDIDKIWERYYKVDKDHKRPHIGSGIGLSLCKKILEQHNFAYGVSSKINEYSEFYFDVKQVNNN